MIVLCDEHLRLNVMSFFVLHVQLSVPQSEASEHLSTLSVACSHRQGTGDRNRDVSRNADLLTIQPPKGAASLRMCY